MGSRGCQSTLKYRKIDWHLKNDCLHQEIKCPKNKGCECVFRRGELEKHLEKDCILRELCPCCNEIIPANLSEHTDCLLKLGEELSKAREQLQETESAVKIHIGALNELQNKLRTLNVPQERPKQRLNYPKQVGHSLRKNGKATRPVFNSAAKRLKDLVPNNAKTDHNCVCYLKFPCTA
eukprot:TRINITY_DN3413_c0_g1_i5.p1 TRINITY_DN3413_c0_g1~~TRINITY_DN3413_c0_g1_i5.p1  ORF type:complete len:179 (-),score=19.46 TRINITY_DN3413_c0_g1_i5:4-540(-)